MKKFAAAFAVLVFGSMAHAGQVTCSGSVMGYSFLLRAKTSGHKVTGKINFEVTNDNKIVKKDSLKTTSSDIRAGQYVKFSGQNADGAGTVEATYQGNGQYVGQVTAQTSMGSGSVGLACTLTGAIINPDGSIYAEYDLAQD